MITRKDTLKKMCSEPRYKKLAFRLSEIEFDRMVEWLEENDHLGHLEFEYAVNRMRIPTVEKHKKNLPVIQEILTCVNSRVHMKAKHEETKST